MFCNNTFVKYDTFSCLQFSSHSTSYSSLFLREFMQEIIINTLNTTDFVVDVFVVAVFVSLTAISVGKSGDVWAYL